MSRLEAIGATDGAAAERPVVRWPSMMVTKGILSVLLTVCYGLSGPLANPTSTGYIIGTVSDSSGSPIAYANVFVVGTNFGAMSLEDGTFKIAKVPVGRYSLVVKMINVRLPDEITVNVEAEDTTVVNFTAIEVFPPPHPATAVTDVIPQRIIDKIASAEIVEFGLLCAGWRSGCDTLPVDDFLTPYRVRRLGGEIDLEDVVELKDILTDPRSYKIFEGPRGGTMCGSEPHIVYSFFDDWEESREFDRVLVIVSSWCCALRVKGDHSDIYVDVDYAQDRLLDLLVRLCPEDSLSMESYKLRHGKYPGPPN